MLTNQIAGAGTRWSGVAEVLNAEVRRGVDIPANRARHGTHHRMFSRHALVGWVDGQD